MCCFTNILAGGGERGEGGGVEREGEKEREIEKREKEGGRKREQLLLPSLLCVLPYDVL